MQPFNCVALAVTEFASEKRRLGRRTPKACGTIFEEIPILNGIFEVPRFC
jgi:hypothetical protein